MGQNARIKEIWKPIKMNIEWINETRYEISNLGRIRSFNKISNGRILKHYLADGYPAINTRLRKPRSVEAEKTSNELEEEIKYLQEKRRELIREGADILRINRASTKLEKKEKQLADFLKKDIKDRTINKNFLIHRVMAIHFLPRKPEEVVVGHLDYNKKNNRLGNLKWMTKEENQIHREKSPYVIAEKKQRFYTQKKRVREKGMKLTSTQVIRIKKQLKRGRKQNRIAKEFKVSEMQISRIKSGENWDHVKVPE